MSVNGDSCILRNGRSTSKMSIYDYPEHLNPFYEDENHKRLRFWNLNKEKSSESGRRSSFSFGGLREMWTLKSFRLRKKSSSLGINKTSESPPTLRRELHSGETQYGTYDPRMRHTTNTNGFGGNFDRNVPYRSSLQDMSSTTQTLDRNGFGFRRNDRYRSTTGQQQPVPPRRYVYGGSVTPQPVRSNVYNEDGTISRGSSQLSIASTNPFDEDEDDDNDVVIGRMPNSTSSPSKRPRKKRRAPPPPIPVHQIITEESSSPTKSNGSATINQEELDISNLTAEIENFVRSSNETPTELRITEDETTIRQSRVQEDVVPEITVTEVQLTIVEDSHVEKKKTDELVQREDVMVAEHDLPLPVLTINETAEAENAKVQSEETAIRNKVANEEIIRRNEIVTREEFSNKEEICRGENNFRINEISRSEDKPTSEEMTLERKEISTREDFSTKEAISRNGNNFRIEEMPTSEEISTRNEISAKEEISRSEGKADIKVIVETRQISSKEEISRSEEKAPIKVIVETKQISTKEEIARSEDKAPIKVILETKQISTKEEIANQSPSKQNQKKKTVMFATEIVQTPKEPMVRSEEETIAIPAQPIDNQNEEPSLKITESEENVSEVSNDSELRQKDILKTRPATSPKPTFDSFTRAIERKQFYTFDNATENGQPQAPVPRERKRSVKDIIASINHSQSLLKFNQDGTTTTAVEANNNLDEPPTVTAPPRRRSSADHVNQSYRSLAESEKEIKKMLEKLDKPLNNAHTQRTVKTNEDNINGILDDLADSLNNNHITSDQTNGFKKCIVKTELSYSRESSPTTSNLDWNPVPKPKRTKNLSPEIKLSNKVNE